MSYSHAATAGLASILQSASQRLAKPWYRQRSIRIFRDQTNLSVAPGLWAEIEKALNNSEYFILLASPQAAASLWVQREVGYWLDNKLRENFLIILTEGELAWDDKIGDFNWERTTSLPPNLRKSFTGEPLHIDLRWATEAQHLSLSNARFRDAVAGLVATLHGTSKDALLGEDLRQHRKVLRLAAAIIVSLTLLASLTTWQTIVATEQRRLAEHRRLQSDQQAHLAENRRVEAEHQRKLADERRREAEAQRKLATESQKRAEEQGLLAKSREMAAKAASELAVDPELSVVLALRAMEIKETAQAKAALRRALFKSYRRSAVLIGLQREVIVSHDAAQLLVTGIEDHKARLLDAKDGHLLAEYPHEGVVSSALFSPDYKRVLTASERGEVRVWDLSGRLVIEITEHEEAVNSAVFSSDGKAILTSCDDGNVRLWDTLTGRLILKLNVDEEGVAEALLSRDGARIVTLSQHKVSAWNTEGSRLFDIEGEGDFETASLSPDNSILLTVGDFRDPRALLWNANTGNLISDLEHDDAVRSAVFSPDGRSVLTASEDGVARIWEVSSARLPIQLRGHEGGVLSATFNPQGNLVATASNDRTARIWEVATGRVIAEMRGEHSPIHKVAFSQDGTRLLTRSNDGASLWMAAPGYPFAEMKAWKYTAAEFSPDGNWIIIPGYERNEEAELWNQRLGSQARWLRGHQAEINDITFSSDSRRALTASDDGTARVWEIPSGRLVSVLRAQTGSVNDVTLSPDGQIAATSGAGKVLQIWDASTGRNVTTHAAADYRASAVFSPDSSGLLTILDDRLQLWEARSGRLITELGSGDFAKFSPDGQLILTRDSFSLKIFSKRGIKLREIRFDGERYPLSLEVDFSPDSRLVVASEHHWSAIRIWNALTGEQVAKLDTGLFVSYPLFSPAGGRLLTVSLKSIVIWETATWSKLVELGQADSIMSVEFSRDERWILTACADGSVRVWDSETGRPELELHGHDAAVGSASFTPDAKVIITRSGETVRLFSCQECVSDEELVSLGRIRNTHRLSAIDE